jgi:uncharacterized protein with FMN-binding domain
MKKVQKILLSFLSIPALILSSCTSNSSTNIENTKDIPKIETTKIEKKEAEILTTETIKEEVITPTPTETIKEETIVPTPAETIKEETVIPTPTEVIKEETVAPTPAETIKEEVVTPTPAETIKEETVAPTTIYKDGVYNNSGTYTAPTGPESIMVKLVLKNDIIDSVTVTPGSEDTTTKQFQGKFSSGIATQVIGKKLSSLGNIGAVNGSSLTGKGFNSAIANIKNSAKN